MASFLTATIVAGQVLRTITLLASALSNTLINGIVRKTQPVKKEIE